MVLNFCQRSEATSGNIIVINLSLCGRISVDADDPGNITSASAAWGSMDYCFSGLFCFFLPIFEASILMTIFSKYDIFKMPRWLSDFLKRFLFRLFPLFAPVLRFWSSPLNRSTFSDRPKGGDRLLNLDFHLTLYEPSVTIWYWIGR